MNMLMKKEKEKAPSKKLKEKLHACASSFQKLGNAVNEVLEQGRQEGFTDREIGQMIREEMLRAGLTRQTVSNYLPKSAKAKPRGNPSGRFSGPKFSKNFLLNAAVELPGEPQPEAILIEDILAIDEIEEQKQQTNTVGNAPVSESSVVGIQRTRPKSIMKLDPAEGEYDIEHLEKYSRNALEQIIKWQHKHLQEDHNKGTPWKSKYMSLKAAYKKATGRDWVD
jgi:hypothetical protein